MKFNKLKNGFSPAQRLLVAAIIGLLAALVWPAQAQLAPSSSLPQTGQPNFFYLDTNSASFALTNGQTKTFTAGGTTTYKKTIRQNQGLSLFLSVWSTNTIPSSASTNYTVKFDLTGEGSTWTAGNGAYPLTWTVPLAGNTGPFTNTFWTNLPATTLSNVRQLQATSISTTCGTNVFGALGYSQSTQ